MWCFQKHFCGKAWRAPQLRHAVADTWSFPITTQLHQRPLEMRPNQQNNCCVSKYDVIQFVCMSISFPPCNLQRWDVIYLIMSTCKTVCQHWLKPSYSVKYGPLKLYILSLQFFYFTSIHKGLHDRNMCVFQSQLQYTCSIHFFLNY